MSMDVGGSKKGPKSDLNVTPLIDVVLVLLIIFMVLTPSMLKHLPAMMPKMDEDQTPQAPGKAPILVEYTSKRELTVNTEPVALAALGDKLKERLRFDTRKVVFFKADDDANYGEVVRLMDVARGVGARTLAIVSK
jgi:biopolymer transport protein ExbD